MKRARCQAEPPAGRYHAGHREDRKPVKWPDNRPAQRSPTGLLHGGSPAADGCPAPSGAKRGCSASRRVTTTFRCRDCPHRPPAVTGSIWQSRHGVPLRPATGLPADVPALMHWR
nr:MAG TPA_asm: hypothetical protein [Caudoviricetes sp.]